jgi:lysylphosphatidylglycerol synthetase-like protein (DUF2156 family)
VTDLDPVTEDISEVDNKKIIPRSVKAARALFFLIAAIWILFGIVSLIADSIDSAVTIAILMFINAAVMIFIGWGLGKQTKQFYYLGLVVLAANIFLTITDEFGWFDLLVLTIYVLLFVLLLASYTRYRPPEEHEDLDR